MTDHQEPQEERRKSKGMQDDLQHYPADKARQGEIVLRRPWQRAVFFGALAVFVVLVLVFGVLGIYGRT